MAVELLEDNAGGLYLTACGHTARVDWSPNENGIRVILDPEAYLAESNSPRWSMGWYFATGCEGAGVLYVNRPDVPQPLTADMPEVTRVVLYNQNELTIFPKRCGAAARRWLGLE